jgi:transcriptional regulator with XRE-family HTH domain
MAKSANSIDKHIGMRVRRTRQFRDMSQEVFAAELGVSLHQVKKYESGFERIGACELAAICRVLRVRPSFFFADVKVRGGDRKERLEGDSRAKNPSGDPGGWPVALGEADTARKSPILDLLRRLEAELRVVRSPAASVSGVPDTTR